MSFNAVCGWTFLRSLLIALVSLYPAVVVSRLAKEAAVRSAPIRFATWVAIWLPFLTPGLLTAYAWSNTSLGLVQHPVLNEALYCLLAATAYAPVGATLLYLAPPVATSPSAVYCRRLALRGESWFGCVQALAPFHLRGRFAALLPAGGVVFLLAFQEFEIASRMQFVAGRWTSIPAWTVQLFDAWRDGLPPIDAARLLAKPVLLELAVLVPVCLWVVAVGRSPSLAERARPPMSRVAKIFGYAWLACAVVVVLLIPFGFVFAGTLRGLGLLVEEFQFTGRIATSLLIGLVCGITTWWSAGRLWTWPRSRFTVGRASSPSDCNPSHENAVRRTSTSVDVDSTTEFRRTKTSVVRSDRLRWAVILIAVLPGLCGALAVSTGVALASLTPPFIFLYDSPLPLLLGMTLFLLPRAIVLRMLLDALHPPTSLHASRLLAASPAARQRSAAGELNWWMHGRARFLGAAVVCHWAYWNLTVSDLLAPLGTTPAPVELYNQMHYRSSELLSGRVLAAAAAPVVLVGVAWCLRRWATRRA